MRCSTCGNDNREGRKFCAECGTALASKCPRCGVSNEPGEKFCGECGAALGATAAAKKSTESPIRVAERPASDNLEGERKTVTALFADIKGSTELEQDLDPEEARAIVDPALKLMIDSVQRYDGYVVQSTGDGIFAIFGAPVAHEDHPQRALYSALRMQDELRRYSTKLVADGGNPLEARIGASTGEVVVRSISTGKGHVEYTPIGHTVNLASRMQVVAPTGSIAIGENTRKLVEGYFALKPRGPTRVKGIAEPVNVYEVTGLGPLRTRLQRAAGRGLTKFVGREREMEALRRALEQAEAGRGQIAAAMAEAGTGKSRLFFEFKAKHQSGWMVLEAFSVSHGKASAYLPVLDLLYTYFDIKSEDDARKRREKVNGRIVTLDPALEDTRPYLFALLGIVEGEDPLAQMDANIRKRRTLDAIKRILLRESLNQPLIVMFEDLHWIDEQTQELLNLLADAIANARILLLVNYRPQYRHDWGSKTYYTQLRLDPLGKESADEMLAALLSDGDQLAALRRLIIERTEGNPFFMEEAVQVLLDEGALVRNGATRLTKPIGELKIPPTVQGILAARIDRLPADEKDLLQTLAVIGREFPLSLVRAVVTKSDDELGRMLDDLQLGEFIYEQPAVGDTEYIFKHALTQQVAHDSLLLERRKSLHEQIGIAIEALYADRLEEHLPELANHYKQSRNTDKAVHFLRLVAEQAAARSAITQAEAYFHDAIHLLGNLPASSDRDATELGLQATLGGLLIGKSFGAPEREPSLRRALELCERIGDASKTLPVFFHLTQFYIQQLRLSEASILAHRAMSLTEPLTGPLLQLQSWHNLGETCWWSGDIVAAHANFERALSYHERVPSETVIDSIGFDLWLLTRWFMGLTDLLLGRPEKASAVGLRLEQRARANLHPYSKALGFLVAAWDATFRGANPELIRKWNEPARSLCEQYGFAEVFGIVQTCEGVALFKLGERQEGLNLLREGHNILEGLGSRILSTWRLGTLASMCLESGDQTEAEAFLNNALENMERTNERWFEPEVYRIAAEILGREPSGKTPAKEDNLRKAIDIARTQNTRWYELRATTSLARLLRDTDRRDEARAMLSDIYNWFTEGFDTTDLKDAKALLEELSN